MSQSADQLRTTGRFTTGMPPSRAKKLREQKGYVFIQELRDGKCYVYFIGGETGAIKIGLSIAPVERLASMQMGSPIKLSILAKVEGDAALEKAYHKRFSDHRSHGEWFERCPEILDEIERLNQQEMCA